MIDIAQEFINSKTVPVICGPTASGKTGFSIALAKSFGEIDNCQIISADSRQVYKHLEIGTAKATPQEQESVPHHLIDFLELDEEYSSGRFAEDAAAKISSMFASNHLPIVVGGTGFYISSLFDGLDTDLPRSDSVKKDVLKKYASMDREELFEELKAIDPKSAEKYSDKNPVRLLRAIEYYYQTGNLFSDLFKSQDKKQLFKPFYLISDFILSDKREELYARINKRCEVMWKGGLIQETENALIKLDISLDTIDTEGDKVKNIPNSLNTVGYKETILYLKGEYSEQQAIELFQRNSRRYAKRQITWFRRVLNNNPNNSLLVNYLDSEKIEKLKLTIHQHLFS